MRTVQIPNFKFQNQDGIIDKPTGSQASQTLGTTC